MDSHLIYTVSNAINRKVIWNKVTPDSEWIYFGGKDDNVDIELVVNTINTHFADDMLYVVVTRKDSVQTPKKSIALEIKEFLRSRNFLIWDTDFKKAIEFNEIGTMRCGQLN